MGSYDDNDSRSQATPLSRALVKYRKEHGLTLAQLARAIQRGERYLEKCELGRSRPSPQALAVLGAMFGVDLAAAFPVPGTSSKELAAPANIKGRLRHLIDLTCGGVGRKFAEVTGLTKSDVSKAINGRVPLSAAKAELIYRTLPGLSRDWFARGKGEPFGAQEGPDQEPMVLPGLPRPITKRVDKFPPNGTGPRVKEVMKFAVFNQCELTGGLTGRELRIMGPAVLEKIAHTLNFYAHQDCGLTPAQVSELAHFLHDFAQAAGGRKPAEPK